MKHLFLVLAVLGLTIASCKKQATPQPSTPPPSTTSGLTVTVNSATITAGQSVMLTATGATTYSWSTGATTSSIVVSPTVTTSYTVKGTTGSNTGTATSVVTVQPVSNHKDSVWVDVYIEAPQSPTFNYHYDSTNTRLLVNGHRVPNSVFNIYKDAQFANSIARFTNFGNNNLGVPHSTAILMKSGDTLTVQIDSLYYTNGNSVTRGGKILLDVNTKPYNANTALVNAQIYTSANNLNPVTNQPIGRPMGTAPANGMGQSTQPFYWYLGGQFTYKWVKP